MSWLQEIVVYLYYFDNRQHHAPHIHAGYQDDKAVMAIADGEVLEGSLPMGKLKLVQAWIELHRDDLLADWQLAASGQQPFQNAPLR